MMNLSVPSFYPLKNFPVSQPGPIPIDIEFEAVPDVPVVGMVPHIQAEAHSVILGAQTTILACLSEAYIISESALAGC